MTTIIITLWILVAIIAINEIEKYFTLKKIKKELSELKTQLTENENKNLIKINKN